MGARVIFRTKNIVNEKKLEEIPWLSLSDEWYPWMCWRRSRRVEQTAMSCEMDDYCVIRRRGRERMHYSQGKRPTSHLDFRRNGLMTSDNINAFSLLHSSNVGASNLLSAWSLPSRVRSAFIRKLTLQNLKRWSYQYVFVFCRTKVMQYRNTSSAILKLLPNANPDGNPDNSSNFDNCYFYDLRPTRQCHVNTFICFAMLRLKITMAKKHPIYCDS